MFASNPIFYCTVLVCASLNPGSWPPETGYGRYHLSSSIDEYPPYSSKQEHSVRMNHSVSLHFLKVFISKQLDDTEDFSMYLECYRCDLSKIDRAAQEG